MCQENHHQRCNSGCPQLQYHTVSSCPASGLGPGHHPLSFSAAAPGRETMQNWHQQEHYQALEKMAVRSATHGNQIAFNPSVWVVYSKLFRSCQGRNFSVTLLFSSRCLKFPCSNKHTSQYSLITFRKSRWLRDRFITKPTGLQDTWC